MKFAVRTAKLNVVRDQFLSLLGLRYEAVTEAPTIYSGITLLSIADKSVNSLRSMCNIEAILLDEAAATELLHPMLTSEPSLKSLNGVDELEQYEHLSQLLYIQKSTKCVK